jgi:hypothetical protein
MPLEVECELRFHTIQEGKEGEEVLVAFEIVDFRMVTLLENDNNMPFSGIYATSSTISH